MDDLSFINWVRENKVAVISVSTASQVIGKNKGYASLFLHRLKKRGILKQVEKNKYTLPETPVNAIASNITSPAYISLLSAYSIHRLTTQMPIEVQVLTTHNKKNIQYGDTNIRFIKTRPYMIYGIEKTSGFSVAEKEKAVADSLKMPQYCPISETYNALTEGDMETDKLLEYTKKTKSHVALKRLGYLMEKKSVNLRGEITVNKKYQPLNPLLPKKGPKDRVWGLIINERL